MVQIEQILVSFKRVIMWRELYRLCAKCSMKPFLNCLVRSPCTCAVLVSVISLTVLFVCCFNVPIT